MGDRTGGRALDDRLDLFVVPTYAPGQLGNARRTAELAAAHGFRPVIVCNSASASAALADDPRAMSVGANTGYGGAAALVAGTVEFETLVLCNDDLIFTDESMAGLRVALDGLRQVDGQGGRAAVLGFLPREHPGVVPLPDVRGVLAIVTGLAAVTRRRRERAAGRAADPVKAPVVSSAGVRRLADGLGFPFVCVAITRQAWDGLGGFDPRFPLYFEDTDLLTRARRAGIPVSVALGDCTHTRTSSGRTVLAHILPLMALGARNYLELHRGLPRAAAAALVTGGLAARTVCWLPLRPNRKSELRGILGAVSAVWRREPAPMPPWS